MGIYDRDYYREGSGGPNPFSHRMHACITLVALYAAVFVVQIGTREEKRIPTQNHRYIVQYGPGEFTEGMRLDANKVLNGEVWRIGTYAFAHDPVLFMPIVVNIIFLLWVGRYVEDIYGWKEFACFYLLAGLLSGVVFVGAAAALNLNGTLIGPGGAITATLFLFALHYPRWAVFGYVPIWVVAGFYVLNDALGFLGGRLHPAAFAAHAVGAAFAFIYHHYSLRVSTWLPGLPSRGNPRARKAPKLHIFRDETPPAEAAPSPAPAAAAPVPGTATAPAAAATAADMDEHLEAKLDEVLEKVKKHGQESLTEEERAVLFRASEIYKKRRKQQTGG
jgi:membrane associated rhomboid family serine protease